MKILIADDDPQALRVLESSLNKWGYHVVSAKDGQEVWEVLQREDAPSLVILDWVMPGIDGVTLCRKVRESFQDRSIYILFLTGKGEKEDIVEGLSAGADDFMTKPFDFEELMARVKVGERIIQLQIALKERVKKLEDTLVHVKRLEGLLPICSYCKRISDDQKQWQPIDMFVAERSEAQFTHIICPECNETIVKPELEHLKRERKKK